MEAILKAKVAQICNHVGYHAITQDSSNILLDLYRRTIHHIARHCKEAANNNRRIEPTLTDLVQAYDFVGISIPELQEHIDTVKIPLEIEITQAEPDKPLNRVQRNCIVDDLLEAEKTNQDVNDGENCTEGDEDKPSVPLLKDIYQELSSKFASSPVKADKKLRPERLILLANKLKIPTPLPAEPLASTSKITPPKKTKAPKLEVKAIKNKRGPRAGSGGPRKKKPKTTAISPLDPSFAEPPSFFPLLEGKLDEPDIEPPIVQSIQTPTPPPPVTPAVAAKTKLKEKKKAGRKKGSTLTKKNKPVVDEPKKKRKSALVVEEEPAKKHVKSPIVTPAPTPPIVATTPVPATITTTTTPTPTITITVTPTTTTTTATKQTKGKKKKKKTTSNFSIVTETVNTSEEKEWLCPGCGGPDDGDLMVECDTCKEWYHLNCTNLKKPPEDDENWECEICIEKSKQAALAAAKPQTPPPPPQPQPSQAPATTSGSGIQEDCCPECNQADDGTMMIQCDDPFCAKWFHTKCVNLSEEPKENESWFCKLCVEKQQSAFKRRRRPK